MFRTHAPQVRFRTECNIPCTGGRKGECFVVQVMTVATKLKGCAHFLGYASGLSTALAHRRKRLRILMLHGVDSEFAPVFERGIQALASRFSIVPLATLVQMAQPTGREVALTFDDGLLNNCSLAYPILKRLGAPATFFVCPSLLDSSQWLWNQEARERLRALSVEQRVRLAREMGASDSTADGVVEWMKTLPLPVRNVAEDQVRRATPSFHPSQSQRCSFDMMSWNTLAQLDPGLITIGSHTMTHSILSGLSDGLLDQEIIASRTTLEERLGRPVDCFCYPDGDFDERALTRVRATYKIAVTTTPACVPEPRDPHLLPRIPFTGRVPLLLWRMHRPRA